MGKAVFLLSLPLSPVMLLKCLGYRAMQKPLPFEAFDVIENDGRHSSYKSSDVQPILGNC